MAYVKSSGKRGADRTARTVRLAALALLLLGLAAESATPILPLGQVKPGMKGRGRSVFQGSTVEDFEVEVLGVLANVQPKRSVILARLKGRGLESTGVIAGMSGSPVYIDGKLIGAVAYGFSFSKEAIAGITPIEEMLEIGKQVPEDNKAPGPPVPIREDLTQEQLSGRFRESLLAGSGRRGQGLGIVPLELPLVLSGFSAAAYERARSYFAPLGFRAVRAGTGGQARLTPPPAGPAVKPGDAVGVQLAGGDLDISAIGTATYVDGPKVLAFGHPLYNLGSVDYGMTTAEVITVLPSLESSEKMAVTGALIGRFSQDRTPGAAGEVGPMPRLIPLNISLRSGPASRKDFKLKLVNDRFLTPVLVNIAVSTLVTNEQRSFGDLSLDFDADIFLDKGGLSVHLEDLFSGNYDNPPSNLSGLMAAAVHYLLNNEFKDVGIFRIDLNVRALEESRLCALERVLLDKYEVSPGEPVQLKVFFRTLKDESLMEEVTVLTPALPAGTEFQIVVGDASTMQQIERAQYRIQEFVPRNLSQLVRILGGLRKNNRVYFKIIASKPGLFLKGEELPNLPPSLKSMFASPRASASAPTEITRSTLSEYQLPIPYVFRGGASIPVKIRK
jgi:hypothetical protein